MRNRSLDHGMVSYVRVYLASYSGKLVVDSELITAHGQIHATPSRTLSYESYGQFPIVRNAGFCLQADLACPTDPRSLAWMSSARVHVPCLSLTLGFILNPKRLSTKPLNSFWSRECSVLGSN